MKRRHNKHPWTSRLGRYRKKLAEYFTKSVRSYAPIDKMPDTTGKTVRLTLYEFRPENFEKNKS